MKSLDLSKQDCLELKKSFEWIDKNHFATVDMLPEEFCQVWLDPHFDDKGITTHGHLQEVIFLYGFSSIHSLLKKETGKIPFEELEQFYPKWQVKVHLAHLNALGSLPKTFKLDKIPLFLFNKSADSAIVQKWNHCSKILVDLGMRNIPTLTT